MRTRTHESCRDPSDRCAARRGPARHDCAPYDHLTADDIARHVHGAHPEIHVSTVYRTLESLEAWDLVEHVHRGHGAAFFHLAASHPHMVCEECGRVLDVPADEFELLISRVREAYGFELDVAHNALMGRCAEHQSQDHPNCSRDHKWRQFRNQNPIAQYSKEGDTSLSLRQE